LHTRTEPEAHPRRWAIWAAVGSGTFLNVLDNSMLNVSLPTISRELAADVGTIQWVVTGYMLVISSLLLTGGRLADLYGRKRLYILGLLIFTISSTMAGFASEAYQLIAMRVLQGVGSALVQGIGPAIVVSVFPTSERGRALGLNSTTVALGGISGPVLGGFVADALGWRWIFWLRIPIALLVLAATARVLPRDPVEGRAVRFDLAGAATLFFALASLLLALSQGRYWGWVSAPVLGLFGASLLLWVLFVRIELRAASPMLPMAVFKNRMFAAASGASFLTFCAISAPYFVMPFFLIQGLGLAPSQAGLLMIPSAILMSVTAPIAGTLSDRLGSRVLSPIGSTIICTALFFLSRMTPDIAPLDVVWRSALLGLGMGTFMSPNNNALMGSVPREYVGLAAGTMASVRNLGNVVGVAIAGTVLANRSAVHLPELAATGLTGALLESRSLIAGVQDAFVVAASIAACALIVAVNRPRGERDGPARRAPSHAGADRPSAARPAAAEEALPPLRQRA
jgi:EmrB/QacA subfamily drug resistance transporter